MQQPYQIATAQTEQQTTLAQQNRVLRNTYLLLAISMLPTIAGAMLGMGIAFRFFILNPIVSFIAFMAIAFVFMQAIERTKNSVLGVVLLLAFTFFMGMMLSPLLRFTLGLGNGPQLIATAAGGTGVIFFTMASIATVTKKDFSFIGKFLIVGALVTLVAMVANLFLHIPALYLAISAVCIVLFSMYILYDISRVIHGGETNYITATLAIYLDIYNVFVHLLRLLIALSGRD